MKRAFDLVAAVLGLVLLSPVMAVVTVLVKLDTEGPAVFRQVRIGMRGREFRIWKFRTMRIVADGPAVTAGADPRITRVGRWLRSWKLDELPQLLNVVLGDMSLVGPRPEVPQYVDLWPEWARERILSVRPGITDPASLAFRRESDVLAAVDDPERHYVNTILPEKVALYTAYVDGQTFLGDCRILLRTLISVVRD